MNKKTKTAKSHFWVKFIDGELQNKATGYGVDWIILRESPEEPVQEPQQSTEAEVTEADILQAEATRRSMLVPGGF